MKCRNSDNIISCLLYPQDAAAAMVLRYTLPNVILFPYIANTGLEYSITNND